jgi:hypothetical protein
MRALILGYVEDYEADDLRPFVDSLQRTTFSGDILFFTRGLTPETIGFLEAHGIRCRRAPGIDAKHPRPIPKWLGTLLRLESPSIHPDLSINIRLSRALRALHLSHTPLAFRLAKYLWHCNVGRFFYFREYLEAHPEYDAVLITDVRDVVFQRTPFSFDPDTPLTVFEEYPGVPIGKQQDNARWIEQMYGAPALDAIAAHPVLCMGVLMGGYSAMLDALTLLTPDMLDRYIGWGTDQSALNYGVRTGRLSSIQVHEYGSGTVMHMGIAPRRTITLDSAGHVLNDAGDICPVLHQYDRHPDLQTSFLRRRSPAYQS